MTKTYTFFNVEEKIVDFLQLHYEPTNDMYSYIILGCKNTIPCNNITKSSGGIRNFQFIKTTEIGGENKSIQNIVDSLEEENDYYITQNGFSTPKQRDLNHVFTLHNIVIDIDCHSNKMTKKEKEFTIDACHYFLTNDLFSEINFPTPNTIVNTGRGLQLWWAIEPISYKMKHAYHGIRKYLINRIEDILNSVETLQYMKIDKAASQNYAGYFRMPGSYNSKIKKYSTFERLHDEKLDVVKTYYVDNPKWIKKEKTIHKQKINKKSIKRTILKGNDISRKKIVIKNNLVTTREEMLYKLLELRRGEEEGHRDLMLLILYNAYLSVGKEEEEARKAIEVFNNCFEKPFSERKINSYMSTSKRKKYKFSNKRIIELLDISEEEQKQLNFYINKNDQNNTNNGNKKKEKEKRNNKILLLNQKGYSQQDIAKIVGCSQPTVSRVIINSKTKQEKKVA